VRRSLGGATPCRQPHCRRSRGIGPRPPGQGLVGQGVESSALRARILPLSGTPFRTGQDGPGKRQIVRIRSARGFRTRGSRHRRGSLLHPRARLLGPGHHLVQCEGRAAPHRGAAEVQQRHDAQKRHHAPADRRRCQRLGGIDPRLCRRRQTKIRNDIGHEWCATPGARARRLPQQPSDMDHPIPDRRLIVDRCRHQRRHGGKEPCGAGAAPLGCRSCKPAASDTGQPSCCLMNNEAETGIIETVRTGFIENTMMAVADHGLHQRPRPADMMVAAGGGIVIKTGQTDRPLESAGHPPLPPDIPAARPWPRGEREGLHALFRKSARRRPSLHHLGRGCEVPLGESGTAVVSEDAKPPRKVVVDEVIAACDATLPRRQQLIAFGPGREGKLAPHCHRPARG